MKDYYRNIPEPEKKKEEPGEEIELLPCPRCKAYDVQSWNRRILMDIMEQKTQEQMESGEAEMEFLCGVCEKLKTFCEENSIALFDVVQSLRLFKNMDWFGTYPTLEKINPTDTFNFCEMPPEEAMEEGRLLYFSYDDGKKKTTGTIISINRLSVTIDTDISYVGIALMDKETGVIKAKQKKYTLNRISKKQYEEIK